MPLNQSPNSVQGIPAGWNAATMVQIPGERVLFYALLVILGIVALGAIRRS